jgi:hypothetical protein
MASRTPNVNVSYIRTGSKREKIEPFYSMAARIGHFGVRHPVMVREFPWGEKIACEKILLEVDQRRCKAQV